MNEVQIAQLSVWLRSCVAHWLQLDHLHGNEQILTLIGAQGCGKSTYCAQLLPESLRMYFLDHVNLANKFDKDMALTNNLLVNIDELDQIKAQNVKFQHVDDLESMLTTCFRHPEAEEIVRPLMTSEVVGILARSFPEMKVTAGMNVKVGRLLSMLNFERKVVSKGTVYYIVPMKKSA